MLPGLELSDMMAVGGAPRCGQRERECVCGRFAIVGSGGTSSKQQKMLELVVVAEVAGSEGARYCRVATVNDQAGAESSSPGGESKLVMLEA